jgi:hypothetical protein
METSAMRAWASLIVRREGFGGAVLTVLGALAPLPGAGATAWAEEVDARGDLQSPREREFEDPEVERLFREYRRLTGMSEPNGTPPVRSRPRSNRLKGDFWLPDERRRLFGK